MSAFTLTCCSTADRPKSFFDAREIPCACFHWSEGGVDHLDDLRDTGASLDEAHTWALAHRLNVHHWFFSTDLTSYVRGGRVSRPQPSPRRPPSSPVRPERYIMASSRKEVSHV